MKVKFRSALDAMEFEERLYNETGAPTHAKGKEVEVNDLWKWDAEDMAWDFGMVRRDRDTGDIEVR